MKKIKLLYLFIASFSLSFYSCEDGESQKTETRRTFSEVPELKERGVAFGTNEEMDNIFRIYQEAVDAVKKDPNDMEARLTVSEVFINEARLTGKHAYNYKSALQVLDEVLASNKPTRDQRFRALMNKAAVKLSLHKFQEALALGEEALILNDRNSGIYGVLVDANVELGNYQKAVAMGDKMVSIRPDLRSYSRISYLREIHGDVEGAIQAMQMAVEAGYPGLENTEWARITLGKLNEDYGNLSEAEMHYRIALQNRPNYAYALAALGNLERKKGNYDEAEKLINTATKYINEAWFYSLLADVYRDQDFTEKAQGDYAKALKMMENTSESGVKEHEHVDGHGHSHLDGDDHSHTNLDEGHGHEHGLEIANLYLKIGNNLDKALENARSEYENRPDNIDVNKSLATIYYQKGKMEKATEHLNKAMATNSKDPELRTLKGLIEVKNGGLASGKELIRESFRTNPYQEASISEEAKKTITS